MRDFSYNSELLTNYLLGKLPAEEQERLEEEYFCDNEVFLALLDAKDQLISNYLSQKLAAEDRKRFEQYFLTLPGRKQEVKLAASFRHQFSPKSNFASNRINSEPKPSWRTKVRSFWETHQPQLVGVAAMLLIGSTVAWFILPLSKQPTTTEQLGVITISAGQPKVSLSLKPTSVRSSGQNTTAQVGKETKTVELSLEVNKETFPRYLGKLFIKDKENEGEVFSSDSLQAVQSENGKPVVIWQLPADKLPIQDYKVRLDGLTPEDNQTLIGNYDFKVRNPMPENVQQSK